MERVTGLAKYLYRHNLIRYLFVGGTTFMLDLSMLLLLHGKLKLNLTLATSIAYWLSILYNFMLNRWWTFSGAEKKKLHKNILLYSCLLAFNYIFTVISVALLSKVMFYGLAKVITVVIQTIWTYPIYKHYVFGSKQISQSSVAEKVKKLLPERSK